VGEPIGITVALYNGEDEWMFDTGFGRSHHAAALSLVGQILDETVFVRVCEKDGVWCGSSVVEPSSERPPPGSYARSWCGTHDHGSPSAPTETRRV
jgi:hypothetical protein